MKTLWVATFILAGVGACGHSDTMMSDYAQAIDRHMDALQTEETAHASEIASLSTLGAIRDAEAGHSQRMDDHLDEMRLVMRDMAGCRSSTLVDNAGFADSTQKIRFECDDHLQAMELAPGLAAARNEETRHGGAFHDVMVVMRGQWNMMMMDSSGYACSSHCTYRGM